MAREERVERGQQMEYIHVKPEVRQIRMLDFAHAAGSLFLVSLGSFYFRSVYE